MRTGPYAGCHERGAGVQLGLRQAGMLCHEWATYFKSRMSHEWVIKEWVTNESYESQVGHEWEINMSRMGGLGLGGDAASSYVASRKIHQCETDELWMRHEWVINESRVSHEWVMNESLKNESRMSHAWVTSRSRISHEWATNEGGDFSGRCGKLVCWVTNESQVIHEWVTIQS